MYRDQAFGTQSEKMVDGRTVADLNAASFASYRRYIQTFNPEFITTHTIKEVADLCGLTYDGAKYHFTALKKSGKLERSGGDKCGSWVVKK